VDAHLDSLAIEKTQNSLLMFGWRSTEQARVGNATGDVAGVVQCALPAHDPAAAQGVSGHADGIGFNVAIEHRIGVEVLVVREPHDFGERIRITRQQGPA
jgi:hypothetical protein